MKQWLAMAGISAGLTMAAWAQPATPLHAKVSVDWQRLPVAAALRDLGAKANVEFAFDDALVEHLDPVTMTMDDVEAGRVAMRILYPCGLTLENADGRQVRVVKLDPYDELRPKREEVFAFARIPTLTRHGGDDVTISFETEAWCDVTVAIEHANPSAGSGQAGRIVRHLASGVLGLNAPEPFQWNSKAQTLVWDGKDDAGVYVDDKDAVTVRVSLGLKPQFERTLYWSPHKRAGVIQAMAPAPEGVYVFDGGLGIDHVRLFDHDGQYVRTIYPFPAEHADRIPDLFRHQLPDGPTIPIKPNFLQTTFLTSGDNALPPTYRDGRFRSIQPKGIQHHGMGGSAGHALAVSGSRLALSAIGLSRLSTNGADEDMRLYGPIVGRRLSEGETISFRVSGGSGGAATMPGTLSASGGAMVVSRSSITPKRTAFSPDGQWLYLTRHMEYQASGWGPASHWGGHTVQRLSFADGEPETFLGGDEPGSADGQFNMPCDVATDAQGRVYVADHGNHRVQVFSPQGQWLRNIAVQHPADITVDQRTGEIYVFCWPMPLGQTGAGYSTGGGRRCKPLPAYGDITPSFTRLHKFASVESDAKPLAAWRLPEPAVQHGFGNFRAVADCWADPVAVWLTPDPATRDVRGSEAPNNIVILRLKGDTWEPSARFQEKTVRAVRRAWRPANQRPRLYVNPVDGSLYVGEVFSAINMISSKVIQQAMRIDPDTGRLRTVELPFDTESMAFDRDGHVYLRSADLIVRYDPETWREIPFDYGEERSNVAAGSGGSLSRTVRQVLSGAVFPGNKGWHQGEMHVNVKGQIVVGSLYSVDLKSRTDTAQVHDGGAYRPEVYPGRYYAPGGRFGGMFVHVMDRHGRMLHSDAVPGLIQVLNGVALDASGDLYFMTHRTRAYNGEAGFNPSTGTLIKGTPGQVRLLSNFGAPVPMTDPPARPHDLMQMHHRRRTWVEGAHWFYGGAGFGGGNIDSACTCWNARFALDYFARSFTPEIDRYNVGVVDSAGNLILRVGRYGNVDDGMPLVKDDGLPSPRSIGGDEVALFYAPYVATHSDRRLFISDPGNARVVSVKLGYHADETVALKDVPDGGAERP